MTGLYPSRTGVFGNIGAAGGNPLQMRTIGAILQQAGYYTAYFGKWHLGKDPAGTAGWDEDLGVTGPETRDDKEVTRRASAFLETTGRMNQPFALFLSYNNPHDIYQFNRETDPAPAVPLDLPSTWHCKDLATAPKVQRQFMTEDQGKVLVNSEGPAWQRYRELYREKVTLYDKEVGHVFAVLENHRLSDTTLVIATSDHGDMDGQHRLIYKGPFMYDHMMRVPLIIRPPARDREPKASKIVDFHAVNVDLVPTIAEFAGITISKTDGISLKPLMDGGQNVPERSFVIGQYYSKQKWVNPIRMIRTRRYKYVRYRYHGEELYDLEPDPTEIVNCAENKAYESVKKEMSEQLEQWMKQHNDPFNSQHPTTREGEILTRCSSVTQ